MLNHPNQRCTDLEDHLQQLEKTRTAEQTWQRHIDFSGSNGCCAASYGYDKGFSVEFKTTFSEETLDQFKSANDFIYQKVKAHFFRTGRPLEFGTKIDMALFADNEEANSFMKNAADDGWEQVIAFPIPSLDVAVGAGCAFGIEGDREYFEYWKAEKLPIIQQATMHMHNKYQRCLREEKKLSKRELECLRLLASGLKPEQIAYELGLKTVTVRLHLTNARTKLGVKTREEMISEAILTGILRDHNKVSPFDD